MKKVDDLKDIQGAQVLLVEDNEINQQVAMEILQGAGLIVTVANDGQQGLDAAKKDQYDAILMDIQMPVMDGYDRFAAKFGSGNQSPLTRILMYGKQKSENR